MNFHFIAILNQNFLQLSRIFFVCFVFGTCTKETGERSNSSQIENTLHKKIRRAYSFNEYMPTITLIT